MTGLEESTQEAVQALRDAVIDMGRRRTHDSVRNGIDKAARAIVALAHEVDELKRERQT